MPLERLQSQNPKRDTPPNHLFHRPEMELIVVPQQTGVCDINANGKYQKEMGSGALLRDNAFL